MYATKRYIYAVFFKGKGSMAYTENEAIEIAKVFLKKVSQRHPVYSAYLFGSYARGNHTKKPLRYFMKHRSTIPYLKFFALWKMNLKKTGWRLSQRLRKKG